MPGVSDLTRIKKQQDLIISMMQRINNFNSFNDFLSFVNALENTFTIDRNISIIEASNLLWDFRNTDFKNINKQTVPTYNYTTENGAQVLILEQNFYDFISSNDILDWKQNPKLIVNNRNISGEYIISFVKFWIKNINTASNANMLFDFWKNKNLKT